MADVKTAYGTNGQAFTITLASLASSATAGRESTVIDNTSDKFLDVLVSVAVALGAGTIANDRGVYVYCYATVDNGGLYTEGATGSDAAFTMTDPTSLKILGFIPTPTQSLTYEGGPWSVAGRFDGSMPAKWGIFVRNYSGIALTGTEGNHTKKYQGIYQTVT